MSILDRKFNKKIQLKLNDFFYDGEYQEYTLRDLLKIALYNVLFMAVVFALMIIGG